MAGRGDSFYPIDQRQEHNNAGIRVSRLMSLLLILDLTRSELCTSSSTCYLGAVREDLACDSILFELGEARRRTG